MLDEFSKSNLDEIFDGRRRYAVPPYQRGYAWELDQVDDFLSDLESAKDFPDDHFFGFILTVSDPNDPDNSVKVIDGQQRLSTVMLFLVCARNFFERTNTPAAKKYQTLLESRIHTSEYEKKPIFALSKTNQDLFKEILIQIPIDRKILDVLSTNDSNEMLVAAYKKIRSWVLGKDTELIQNYIDTLFTKFVVVRYDYLDEQKAYNLFNLINNRGIGLNESDHIKNYLFTELEKYQGAEAMDEYDEIWTEMRETVTSKKQANYKNLDTFLHHYLLATNSYRNFTRPKLKDMYRAFRSLINDDPKKLPNKIINELNYWSKILNVLRDPKPNQFDQNPTILYYLKMIKQANAVYVYPPMLIAYDRYWKRGDKILFQIVVMLCFKYHLRAKVIAEITTSSYEHQMRKLVKDIRKSLTASKLSESIVALTEDEDYPSTAKVFNNLETMAITTGRTAVALLQEVEYAKTKKRNLDPVTLEHIMPKKPIAWGDYIYKNNKQLIDNEKTLEENIATIHQKHLNLLGNQTILSKSNNKNARNNTFERKKEDYEQHPKYKITEELIDIPVWNAKAILRRNSNFSRILCDELDLNNMAKYLHKEYQEGVEPEKAL